MPRPRGPRGGAQEKPKNFWGSMRRLLKNLNSWKFLLIFGLILACASSVLALIAPNKLSDFTDEISKGLVPNTEVLTKISNKMTSNFNEENFEKTSTEIMTSEKLTASEKNAYKEVISKMTTLENKEDASRLLLTLPDDVLKFYLTDFKIDEQTITVKDQLELITLLNNRGEYRSNTIYYRGDYVFYEGYWWVYIDNKDYEWGPVAPGVDTTHRWKKIDMNWDSRSGYQTGDIVIYNGKYYKCTSDLLVAKYDIIVPGEYYEWKDARLLWQELPNYSSNEKNLIECNVPSSIINIKEKTVLNKLNNIDLNTIPTYDGINSHYDCVNNKYVKIEMGNSGIYEYFVKIFDNLGEPNQKVYNSKTEKFEVGWQKLSLDYDENSAYVNGDVVYTGNYRSYIIATLNAGQIFEYDNFGKLVSINPDNAGKINFYIPLDQCYSNYSNKYNQWWIHYNN